MFCPNCGNQDDVLDTFCNACNTHFVVLAKDVTNLLVTELHLISDVPNFAPFYKFESPETNQYDFFNLRISDLSDYTVTTIKIENYEQKGLSPKNVKVWKKDGKIYLDIGEYSRLMWYTM